jgi:hypothetical protein
MMARPSIRRDITWKISPKAALTRKNLLIIYKMVHDNEAKDDNWKKLSPLPSEVSEFPPNSKSAIVSLMQSLFPVNRKYIPNDLMD